MNPRLIILHGLNNTVESFYKLRDHFDAQGFDCKLIPLPGHGNDRSEITSFELAYKSFEQQLNALVSVPYYVLAFSTGALYFQHWLARNKDLPKPKAQFLLAPALFVKNLKSFETLAFKLPKFLLIPSQTPRAFRRYQVMYFWEYRILFEAIRKFQEAPAPLVVPTYVFMDPKDELVDHSAVKAHFESVRGETEFELRLFQNRDYLTWKRPGKYHVIFHPDYLSEKHWVELTHTVLEFFKRHA